jgi:uncharacterized protein YbcI
MADVSGRQTASVGAPAAMTAEEPVPVPRTHPLTGDALNAAVTDALVGIHAEHLSHVPAKAVTFHDTNVVVTLMHDVLTPAERSLASDGSSHAAVRDLHQQLHEVMDPDLRAAVEQLTDRTVTAVLHAMHFEPDVSATTFVLDEAL